MNDAVSNTPELSVSELAGALKRTIEDAFGQVRLRGEITGYRGPHSSGHVYFSLKDQNAKIDAVIWKGVFSRIKFRPEDGLEVIATGRITTFPGKSSYQIVIEAMEPAGAGALMALLEERKRKLQAEGLFDPARKQLLPYLPEVIGVITSPTGAVIRDVLHRLSDRFPRHVLVWPVRVQGEGSAAEVAAAIAGFNAAHLPFPRPDVLIVARGGGSLEDLWSFNEEIVLRSAAQSEIPLVSAIGHETDWTLLDLVADIRAPTPTAAAEMVVPVRADLLAGLRDRAARLSGGTLRTQERRRRDLSALIRALPNAERVMEGPRQRLDLAALKREGAIKAAFDRRSLALSVLARKLGAQTPQARLARVSEKLNGLMQRLPNGIARLILARRESMAPVGQRLIRAFSTRIVIETRDLTKRKSDLAALSRRFERALPEKLTRDQKALASLTQLLKSLGYKQVLARGFALVRDGENKPIRTVGAAKTAQRLSIEFADGVFDLASEPQKPKRADDSKPKSGQGSLF